VKVVAIVQARMNSSRLPGKVLADVHGRTMLQCLLDRVKSVKEIDEIVVATSESTEDDVLEQWLINNNITCFRGSELDVLDRYYFCAKEYSADIIVRITADDPLKDPDIIRRAIAIMQNDSIIDYCSNTLTPSYPEGLDIEVFKCSALDYAFGEIRENL
jgi:spore coat polysaccharide biosynthesis protein SpsF